MNMRSFFSLVDLGLSIQRGVSRAARWVKDRGAVWFPDSTEPIPLTRPSRPDNPVDSTILPPPTKPSSRYE